MKLIMAIIDDEYTNSVLRVLMAEKIKMTKLSTSGGFLSRGNTTLLLGVDDEKVDNVIELVKSKCHPKKVKSGDSEFTIGVNLFVLPIDKYIRI
ncbi:MAG: cyclic-di-AMP receptor [Clostridia bacterium]|nr:cyclic-di-AMP receptor [Clostridia bacterium]